MDDGRRRVKSQRRIRLSSSTQTGCLFLSSRSHLLSSVFRIDFYSLFSKGQTYEDMDSLGGVKRRSLKWSKIRLKENCMPNLLQFSVIAFIVLGPVLVSSQAIREESYYSLVASKMLRPNSDYLVAVSMQYIPQTTVVVVEIIGNQDSGASFKATDSVPIEPFSTRIVRLGINDIGSGTYTLNVRGFGGFAFSNSTQLEYMPKSYSIFIQTDKAIYKPGDKVMYRVLVLTPSLRPVSTTLIDVHFSDGKGHRIKEWRRQTTSHGVFSSELELSEHPVLGAWNITVKVDDQIFHKGFEVAEYVLPKFEVKINVPQHTSYKDGRLVATINAKYTYGEPVKGEITVSANPHIYSGVIQPFLTNPIFKVLPINGKAMVEFDIAKDLRLSEDHERIVQIDVTVEDSLTGRRQNNSAQTLLHRHKYKMELVKMREYFKPGLKYTARIRLVYHDGSPATDEKNLVRVKQFYSYNDEEFTESKHKLSSEGMVELTYYPPLENVTVLRIEAEYLDLKEALPPIAASLSPSNTFVQATLKTKEPAINQLIEVEVTSTKVVERVSYEIFARGGIITANTFVMPRNSTTGLIKVMATQTMAPMAHFIVHFVNGEGEVVADDLEIELNEVLQNYVEAKANKNEYEPGSATELVFTAKPHSFIGVMGVDQSVLLLKSGNDITYDSVLKELRLYDNGEQAPSYLQRDANDERSLHLLPSSFTTEQTFSKSGALVLTNAYVHEHNPGVVRSRTSKKINSSSDQFITLKPDIGPPVVYKLVTRRPLAGPYAFSYIPVPAWNHPRVYLPHDVSDTWLFRNYSVGVDGRAVIKQTIPDTITSWVISAFSIDNINGLGLLHEPLKVKTFKSFFVSVDLPYSVQRGEILAIPVVVFNYLNSDVVADVTMENVGDFEFADYTNNIETPPPSLELYRKRKLSINTGTGKSTTFLIRPTMLGYINIKVVANSRIAGDAVEKKLLVKPEGETIFKNKAMFVDLRSKSRSDKSVLLDIPKNIIPGSEHLEISIIGDIIGSSVLNLGNLLRMPFGCGEQNMLNFVPNIVTLNYLRSTRQLTPSIEAKAVKFLEIGYQQELTFRHSDGSFSAFGGADSSGSTWLTAFVAQSFRQATPFIHVEESIITEALQWLADHQASNGSFPEVGKIYHTEMQGGSTYELALTAYTLIALLENSKTTSQFRNTITRSIEYVVRNLYRITDDSYALALCTYALHLADHPDRENAFNALESRAQANDEMKFWKRNDKESDLNNPWTKVPNSVNVEMTAYALLTYVRRGIVEDAIPVLNWLISQQNDRGGFASTQDTVIAVYALSKLAEVMLSSKVNVNVDVTTNESSRQFTVGEENRLTYQKYELSRSVRSVNFTFRGTGYCVVQVSYRYNVNVTGEWPLFILDPQLNKVSNSRYMQLSVCTSFVGGNSSNMAVMEVSLPSGFTADTDSIPSLLASNKNVKKVETKNGDTQIVLYFDQMTREEICPTVSAYRTHKVAQQKPVPVVEYDYYEQTRKSRTFYEVSATKICDICEGSDCSSICDGKYEKRDPNKDASGAASKNTFNSSIFVAVFLILRKYLL